MFSKGKLKKIGHSPFFLWRIAGLLVIVLTFASIIFSVIFVYQYLYNTLDEANSIVVLRSEPDLGEIKTNDYASDQKLLSFKQPTSTIPLNSRNMFTYTATTSTPSTSLNASSTKATSFKP